MLPRATLKFLAVQCVSYLFAAFPILRDRSDIRSLTSETIQRSSSFSVRDWVRWGALVSGQLRQGIQLWAPPAGINMSSQGCQFSFLQSHDRFLGIQVGYSL